MEEKQQEQVIDQTTALSLTIEDNDIISVINEKIGKWNSYSKKIRLDDRRKLNRDFWKGDQLDLSKLDLRYQVPYIDNIIFDDLETRIALVAGRMPDIIVTPPSEESQSIQNAKDIQDVLEYRLSTSMTKRLMKDALRNYYLDFIGVIKCRWDKNKGENGDFVFELVRANRIGFDETATIPHDGFSADNCDLIFEWIEEPVAVVMSKFPKVKDKLTAMLGGSQSLTQKRMVSKIRYRECWFRWYGNDGSLQSGVCWIYNNLVLSKEKNPYYDWNGDTKITADQTGQYQSNKVYKNFFDQPRMPYMLLSYQNLGESVIDDTTAVEQAIALQKISNKRGAQITELADRVAPRYTFMGSVISKEEARRVDPKDPTESIWLDSPTTDDIRKGMMITQSAPPPPILYQDQAAIRQRIDSKFSTHGTSRGESNGAESGISKQITREGDLTTADDMSDIVVERVVYEMASWSMQMIKMFYDKPHMIRFKGKDGENINREISQDHVEDGMIAEVKASSVDKQTRRADAMALVQSKSIDPQTLFEDLDVDNPKERTRRLLAFQNGVNDGYTSYMQEVEGDAQGAEQSMQPHQAQQDLQAIVSGQPVEPTGIPSAEYVQIFADYASGAEFDQQPPEVQQAIVAYIQKLQQKVNEKVGANGQTQAPVGQPEAQPQAAPAIPTEQTAVQ